MGKENAGASAPSARKHWEEAMRVIPEGWGEREEKPRSARWPKALAERVDRVSADNEHDFTNALFHLVKWSLDEYDRQRASEGKPTSMPPAEETKKRGP